MSKRISASFRAWFAGLRLQMIQQVFEMRIGLAQSAAIWGAGVLADQVRDSGVGGPGARSVHRILR